MEHEQLAALSEIHSSLEREHIDYWLFGGWAVDFHLGAVTRPHADLDIAVWLNDVERLRALLLAAGWAPGDEGGVDLGYLTYRRGDVQLEIACLARDPDATVFTPTAGGRGEWPRGSFGSDIAELRGVRGRVVSRASLIADKSAAHGDEGASEKDRADVAALLRAARTDGADAGPSKE